MDSIRVAMAITKNQKGDYLVLKKSREYQQEKERYSRNPWEVPGGKIESEDNTLTQQQIVSEAKRELKEETKLEDTKLLDCAPEKSYSIEQSSQEIEFYPSLLLIDEMDPEIKLSSEHSEYKWISTADLEDYLERQELHAFNVLDDQYHSM